MNNIQTNQNLEIISQNFSLCNYLIAVLIPCHNEELAIRQVVKDFQDTLPEAKIYVYDNCSTDRTIEKGQGLQNYKNANLIKKAFYFIPSQAV